ncbi:TPA: hypothetical protein ACH3X1_010778 [Trebouxia sp. C0004]
MPMARPRAHSSMKVGKRSKYAPGVFKAHLRSIGQDEERRRQEEGPQETPCAPPQAQIRHTDAQKDGVLHQVIPQVIRHVNCQLYFNVMWNRYKAVIYLNGDQVQEMFDLQPL